MDDHLELLDARLLQWIDEAGPLGFHSLRDRVLDGKRAADHVVALIERGLVVGIACHSVARSDWTDLRCTASGRQALQDWEASPQDHEEIAILQAAQQGVTRGKTGTDLNDHVHRTIGLADISVPVARLIESDQLRGAAVHAWGGDVVRTAIEGVLPAGSERLSRLAAAPAVPVALFNSGDISGAVIIGDKNVVSVSIERLSAPEAAEVGRVVDQVRQALEDEGDQLDTFGYTEIERQCRALDVQLESDTPVTSPTRAALRVIREVALGAAGSGTWQGVAVAVAHLT